MDVLKNLASQISVAGWSFGSVSCTNASFRSVLRSTVEHYTSFEHARRIILSVAQIESSFVMTRFQQVLKVTLSFVDGAAPLDARLLDIFFGIFLSTSQVRYEVRHRRLQLGSLIGWYVSHFGNWIVNAWRVRHLRKLWSPKNHLRNMFASALNWRIHGR